MTAVNGEMTWAVSLAFKPGADASVCKLQRNFYGRFSVQLHMYNFLGGSEVP